jgi:hypothetical protein
MLLIACTNRRPDVAPASIASARPIPEMTAAELAQRVVRLILSIHSKQDITPERFETEIGVAMEFNADDPYEFGIERALSDGGKYSLGSVSGSDGQPARQFEVEFKPATEATMCMQPIGPYRRALVEGGFSVTWISPPRLGSSARWHFERGDVVVTAFVGKDARSDDTDACVFALDVLAAQ